MSRLGNVGGRLYRGEVSVDFVGRRKIFYAVSGLILVVSIVALLVRGLDYSVEFKGGSVFQFSAAGTTTTQVDSVITAADPSADPTATVTHPPGKPPLWSVQTEQTTFAQGSKVQDAIAKTYNIPASQVSRSFVGPTWGGQISEKALQALIAFLIVIVIYLSIAFEWKMASAALIALAHDIVITVGVYALTGFQVSPATVIGLLTILGYSLYDTVVVFDKVRENTAGLTGTRKSTYSDAANLALNQTLVRSINTSLIALLPVAAILAVSVGLLGNGDLKDLSLVLFVGMLSGTYSSICIATPVLTDLKEREPQYKQLARQVALKAAGGRAAQRKAKAAAARGGSSGPAGAAAGTVVLEDQDEAGDQDLAAGQDAGGDAGSASEPVPAGRAAPGTGGARSPNSRPSARQQPRRTSAAKRRPAGKKKRR
ncbi:MAG TPA: protein translocase subunit SecF [Streptosporangiaceae bacterium]|nr:protein translocase subunit SecF [Streptosporangiaceae bacterium]